MEQAGEPYIALYQFSNFHSFDVFVCFSIPFLLFLARSPMLEVV